MQLLIDIVNKIHSYPNPIDIIYMNYHTYQLLEEDIKNLSDNDYYYFSSLGFEKISIVIDMNLKDNMFYFK